MSEMVFESDLETRQKQWLNRLASELEKIEKLMPANFLPSGVEYPPWVERIESELALVLLPAAKLREPGFKVTPKRMGALLGHACGLAVYLLEYLSADCAEAPVLTEAELAQGEACARAFFDWYKAMRRLAKLSLCSCVDQTYEDMTAFLAGFSGGFSQKPKTTNAAGMGNPTFEIYLVMIQYWRVVARFQSVRELHEWLTIIFGANRVGNQKRVEKICQRIGLSFRKPGRPSKK